MQEQTKKTNLLNLLYQLITPSLSTLDCQTPLSSSTPFHIYLLNQSPTYLSDGKVCIQALLPSNNQQWKLADCYNKQSTCFYTKFNNFVRVFNCSDKQAEMVRQNIVKPPKMTIPLPWAKKKKEVIEDPDFGPICYELYEPSYYFKDSLKGFLNERKEIKVKTYNPMLYITKWQLCFVNIRDTPSYAPIIRVISYQSVKIPLPYLLRPPTSILFSHNVSKLMNKLKSRDIRKSIGLSPTPEQYLIPMIDDLRAFIKKKKQDSDSDSNSNQDQYQGQFKTPKQGRKLIHYHRVVKNLDHYVQTAHQNQYKRLLRQKKGIVVPQVKQGEKQKLPHVWDEEDKRTWIYIGILQDEEKVVELDQDEDNQEVMESVGRKEEWGNEEIQTESISWSSSEQDDNDNSNSQQMEIEEPIKNQHLKTNNKGVEIQYVIASEQPSQEYSDENQEEHQSDRMNINNMRDVEMKQQEIVISVNNQERLQRVEDGEGEKKMIVEEYNQRGNNQQRSQEQEYDGEQEDSGEYESENQEDQQQNSYNQKQSYNQECHNSNYLEAEYSFHSSNLINPDIIFDNAEHYPGGQADQFSNDLNSFETEDFYVLPDQQLSKEDYYQDDYGNYYKKDYDSDDGVRYGEEYPYSESENSEQEEDVESEPYYYEINGVLYQELDGQYSNNQQLNNISNGQSSEDEEDESYTLSQQQDSDEQQSKEKIGSELDGEQYANKDVNGEKKMQVEQVVVESNNKEHFDDQHNKEQNVNEQDDWIEDEQDNEQYQDSYNTSSYISESYSDILEQNNEDQVIEQQDSEDYESEQYESQEQHEEQSARIEKTHNRQADINQDEEYDEQYDDDEQYGQEYENDKRVDGKNKESVIQAQNNVQSGKYLSDQLQKSPSKMNNNNQQQNAFYPGNQSYYYENDDADNEDENNQRNQMMVEENPVDNNVHNDEYDSQPNNNQSNEHNQYSQYYSDSSQYIQEAVFKYDGHNFDRQQIYDQIYKGDHGSDDEADVFSFMNQFGKPSTKTKEKRKKKKKKKNSDDQESYQSQEVIEKMDRKVMNYQLEELAGLRRIRERMQKRALMAAKRAEEREKERERRQQEEEKEQEKEQDNQNNEDQNENELEENKQIKQNKFIIERDNKSRQASEEQSQQSDRVGNPVTLLYMHMMQDTREKQQIRKDKEKRKEKRQKKREQRILMEMSERVDKMEIEIIDEDVEQNNAESRDKLGSFNNGQVIMIVEDEIEEGQVIEKGEVGEMQVEEYYQSNNNKNEQIKQKQFSNINNIRNSNQNGNSNQNRSQIEYPNIYPGNRNQSQSEEQSSQSSAFLNQQRQDQNQNQSQNDNERQNNYEQQNQNYNQIQNQSQNQILNHAANQNQIQEEGENESSDSLLDGFNQQ